MTRPISNGKGFAKDDRGKKTPEFLMNGHAGRVFEFSAAF